MAPALDPYAGLAGVQIVDVDATRAVVLQLPLPVLDNHIGVRHASALYSAAWAASHALVRAALAGRADAVLTDSEIRYERVPLGSITTVAEPAGGDWDVVGEADGVLMATAISTNDDGKAVATLGTTWRVGPPARR